MPQPLPPDQLRSTCDPGQFAFEVASELPEVAQLVGQDRALEALHFGTRIRGANHHLFAYGAPGLGKHTMILDHLTIQSRREPAPQDWCYVHHFDEPSKPIALQLPNGEGRELKKSLAQLVESLHAAVPAALQTEDFKRREAAIQEEVAERPQRALHDLQERAGRHNVALIRSPTSMGFAALRDGKLLGPEEFEALPDEEKKAYQETVAALEEELASILRDVPKVASEARDRMQRLIRETTAYAVHDQLEPVRWRFSKQPNVLEWLDTVERDMVDNAGLFGDKRGPGPGPLLGQDAGLELRRYQVNVLVEHDPAEGAPVVYEDQPTLANLVGRVEHMARLGALHTDFTLIKPGALHRANGGYLVLDALRVLQYPFCWEMLKSALRAGQVRVESAAQVMTLASTVSLEPQPVPLQIKVILIGEPRLYYLLEQRDPDFASLFKVPVDFGEQMDRTPDNVHQLACLVATMSRREELRPLDAEGMALLVEESARRSGDARKLSVELTPLLDLIREADHVAAGRDSEHIGVDHVQGAIDQRIRRSDRLRERIQEQIERGVQRIETTGALVGQVNGLSVLRVGTFDFGRPTRITVRTRIGGGKVVDIEREVELGGPLHSKGVLILHGFLGARYAEDAPLSLSASIVFEQSYGGVDGDSASSAELYALLSSLARLPLRQDLAVTGSVDQHGHVQAVGGVNEKIEGFFDVCRRRGLTGTQGVLIPASNVQHLMLRADVVEAVRQGQFQVHAVQHVDEGIALLTGVPAGERDDDGTWPDGSVNRRVEDRLRALAEAARRYASPGGADGDRRD
jgi:lon-related putative ATP-dependent protease